MCTIPAQKELWVTLGYGDMVQTSANTLAIAVPATGIFKIPEIDVNYSSYTSYISLLHKNVWPL